MSAFNAFSSILSPAWKSMARLVLPSRLELKRPDGSSNAAPLAKVIFTTLLYVSPVQMIPACDHTGTPLHFHSSTTSGSACLMRLRTRASVSPRQSLSSLILASISPEGESPPFPSSAPLLLVFMVMSVSLLIDFGLDEAGEISQRILPAEIARFHRNGVGNSFLHDVHLGADGYLPERHRHLHFARQIGIIELVRVAQALAGHELQIF